MWSYAPGPGSASGQGPNAGNRGTVRFPAGVRSGRGAEELGAIIFLHPFGCSLDERLDRFYLANTVAQPAENAVALSHLIFAGVLDRYPRTCRLIAAHAGRIPAYDARPLRPRLAGPAGGARDAPQPPSSYIKQMWFDSLTHSPAELRVPG